MFGYIIPDKDNMYIKDFNVFQAFYCGLCKTLGKMGSQVTRFCTNYDMTFYNIFLHSITNTLADVHKEMCLINAKQKLVVSMDVLSYKVADLAVLFVYYNLDDDVLDGEVMRAPLKWRLACRKNSAAKRLPEIDKLMQEKFEQLHKLEKVKCASIDRVADCFASLIKEITKLLIETDDNIDDFTYNLGRLIYLFDAVDDVEGDQKKNRYNPLLLVYGECTNKVDYIKAHYDDFSFLLNSTYNKIVECYNKMDIKLCEGVLSNTIYLGIQKQIKRILQGEDKCQLTHI